MLGTSESRILISEISKIPGETANIQPLLHGNSTPAVVLRRDQLDTHKHVIIDSTDASEQIYDICYDESNMCCHFALKLASEVVENTVKQIKITCSRTYFKFRIVCSGNIFVCGSSISWKSNPFQWCYDRRSVELCRFCLYKQRRHQNLRRFIVSVNSK